VVRNILDNKLRIEVSLNLNASLYSKEILRSPEDISFILTTGHSYPVAEFQGHGIENGSNVLIFDLLFNESFYSGFIRAELNIFA
jgi:hypothetical protein